MGILKKIKLKGIIRSILKGTADSIPVLNTIVNNVQSNHKESENGNTGHGSIDWTRLITNIALSASVFISVIYFLTGKIPFESLEKIIKLLF